MDASHAIKIVEEKKNQHLRQRGLIIQKNDEDSIRRFRFTASFLGLLLGLVFAVTIGIYSIIHQRQIVSGFSSAPAVIGVSTSQ